MQGHLTGERIEVEIETECKHCGEALHITVDSDLGWSVAEPGARVLVFSPDVDWQGFTDPTIIHAY